MGIDVHLLARDSTYETRVLVELEFARARRIQQASSELNCRSRKRVQMHRFSLEELMPIVEASFDHIDVTCSST